MTELTVGKLITAAQEANWDVGGIATPQGMGFLGTEAVEARTSYPTYTHVLPSSETYTHVLPSSETRTRKAIDDALAA